MNNNRIIRWSNHHRALHHKYVIGTYYCRQYPNSVEHGHHECTIPKRVHLALPTNYCSNPNASQLLIRCMPNRATNALAPPMVIYMMQCWDAWDLMNSWRIAWTTVVSLCLFSYWRNCAIHSNVPNALNIHAKEPQTTKSTQTHTLIQFDWMELAGICLHFPKMYPLLTNPNTPEHLVEQENCRDSIERMKW